jgi:arylsulfatase A-like enzyme
MMKKPNFLVIVADDMGFSDAGCYGGEISTPNLDALAENGVRFTQHYSTGRCWPSRACILTGNYYQQVPKVLPDGHLPNWGRPVPHYLRPLGYRSYHSGKWHVNQFPMPVAHGGFDRSYYIRDYDRNFAVKQHSLNDEPLPPVEPDSGYYSSTAIAERAIMFLREHAEGRSKSPFFMYLAFIAPHFPLHAPQEDIAVYREKYDCGWDNVRDARKQRLSDKGIVNCELSPRQPKTKPPWNLSPEALAEHIGAGEAARAVSWSTLTPEQQAFQARKMEVHAAMIHRLDREAGRVIDQIKAMGQWKNTVTLFVSDNGASAEQIIRGDGHDKRSAPGSGESYLCLGPGWSTASNTPFRYHKSWVHEGGISSPLIVHWPDGIRARGELRHSPSHFVDIVPTLLEWAGQKTEPDWKGQDSPPLAGVSLVRAIHENCEAKRDFIFFRHIGHRALRMDRWKLVAVHHGKWELYDMESDRSELCNLADKHPERVRQMAGIWERAHETFIAQIGETRD